MMFSTNLKNFQMSSLNVMVEKAEAGAILPKKMTLFAAGYDLSLPKNTVIAAHDLTTVSLGFKVS